MSTIDINNTQSNTDIINACLLCKNKKITELNINKECSGIVDLLAIPTDYNKIKAIYFMAGNITQIINIPANITMISASNNKINTIDQFPESIEHIILDNNLFKDTINLSNYIYLKHLNSIKYQPLCMSKILLVQTTQTALTPVLTAFMGMSPFFMRSQKLK